MLGFWRRILSRWKKKGYKDINPDEIFLDSKNLPQFDIHQFEGRLEKPISKKAFSIFGVVCVLIAVIFLWRFGNLEIVNGEFYRQRSDNNMLKQNLLVAPRGIIYSRDGVKLAWNEKNKPANLEQNLDGIVETEDDFPSRKYIEAPGFGNLLGFIKNPAKDKNGFYYTEEYVPKDGAEIYLNEMLSGRNGLELIETAVDGSVVSQSAIEPPQAGENAVLSIDSRVQSQFYKIMQDLAEKVGFQGGAGIIMDIDSGEILSMVSYPEYDSQIMTDGKDEAKIQNYYQDSNNPFLNRVISGLYTPGSIVKPFLAYAALKENIITPEKTIISTGQIEIPNPYDPSHPSIFKDWKAHGPVDMRKAIAVSSDVYFYEIGGGFGSQKGLGVSNIKKYLEMFGFTKKTGLDSTKEAAGVIPDPQWKEKNFPGDLWRLGDTYNTAIGQYGVQITPIQAVRAVAAIANRGKLLVPSILFTATSTVAQGEKIEDINQSNLEVVKEGMRRGVEEGGTASGLNTSAVHVAGKTGTAQLGAKKQFVNSWVIGFFPYENPKYAFAVVMERGPSTNLVGGTYVMRTLLDWMAINTPEYITATSP